MARRAFVRVDVSNALRKVNATEREIMAASEDLQIELATIGRDKMVEYIETRGTGARWMRYTKPRPMPAKKIPFTGTLRDGSFPGRVNTGRMRDAVRVRFERGTKQVRSAFGWIDSADPYFYAQEYGFNAGGFRPRVEVRGMFALRDARQYVVNILPRLAKKYSNRIARGKY